MQWDIMGRKRHHITRGIFFYCTSGIMTYVLFSIATMAAALLLANRYFRAGAIPVHRSYKLVKLLTELQQGVPQAQISTVGVTVRVSFPQTDMFAYGRDQVKINAVSPLQTMANVVKDYENVNVFVNCLAGTKGKEDLDADLAYKRAEKIQQLFIVSGISEDRILATSMGELDEHYTGSLATAEVICYELRNSY